VGAGGFAAFPHEERRVGRLGVPHTLVGLESHSAVRIVPDRGRRKSGRTDTVGGAYHE